jgi:hypothetical protein
MRRREKLILGLGLFLLPLVCLNLSGNPGKGYQPVAGGIFNLLQSTQMLLFALGVATGWATRRWPFSGWAAAALAMVPACGAGLTLIFC